LARRVAHFWTWQWIDHFVFFKLFFDKKSANYLSVFLVTQYTSGILGVKISQRSLNRLNSFDKSGRNLEPLYLNRHFCSWRRSHTRLKRTLEGTIQPLFTTQQQQHSFFTRKSITIGSRKLLIRQRRKLNLFLTTRYGHFFCGEHTKRRRNVGRKTVRDNGTSVTEEGSFTFYCIHSHIGSFVAPHQSNGSLTHSLTRTHTHHLSLSLTHTHTHTRVW
jgi:hypothetical protein